MNHPSDLVEMVELVGGPHCGATVKWPASEPEQVVSLRGESETYERERSGSTAVCKGWLNNLRK